MQRGCQQQVQLGSACAATAASATAEAPISEFQSIFDEWRGAVSAKDVAAMPPSPQTIKGSRLGAAAASTAAHAPASPICGPRNTTSFCSPTFKASPKTPKASRKGSAKDAPLTALQEPDPCGPTLDSFAGRFGFTVTTSITCTSYRNDRCSQEIVLKNRSSALKAEEAVATEDAASSAADKATNSPATAEHPAAVKTVAAGSLRPAVPAPSTAADNNLMLPPMPRLPATALLSQASFQQPITPAAAAAAQRPAAASPHSSPGFFRTVSTGMPAAGLLHSNSSAHESQALAAAAAAASAGCDCHQATQPHMDPLQQLSSYLTSMPHPTGELQQQLQQQQQQMKQNAAGASCVDPMGLQAQAAAVFGAVGASRTYNPPVPIKEEASTPAYDAMMPPNWSPMQSFDITHQFEATQQYLAAHNQQQQQHMSLFNRWRSRSTSLKPGSPIKSKNGGSPSKSRNPTSPSRQHSSCGHRQQYVTSTPYKAILRRSLRRPKMRGPRYDPTSKTGASLLGKHRLSNCSSLEDWSPAGMPHEWVGNTSMDLNELDSWGDESGCLGEMGSMEMGASFGSDGFKGFVFPVDSAFAEEAGMQLPAYACMSPGAAAVAAASGVGLGARRASSISSDWFKEIGVQDLAGSRRCSLFNDSVIVDAPVAVGGDGINYFRCSDADVESEVQRGLAFRPVWGVQACVGLVGLQCLIEGDTTPHHHQITRSSHSINAIGPRRHNP